MDGDLIAEASLHMSIETVLSNVEFSVDKPLCVRKVPFEHLRPWLLPTDELRSLASPKCLKVCSSLLMQASIADMGAR